MDARLRVLFDRMNTSPQTIAAFTSLVRMMHHLWHTTLSVDHDLVSQLEAASEEFHYFDHHTQTEAWTLLTAWMLGQMQHNLTPCQLLRSMEIMLTRADPRMN